MTRLTSFLRTKVRKRVRQGLRPLLGPTFYDAAVQFGRLPSFTDLRRKAIRSRCIFIEPHFDDVAFSCGGLLATLLSSVSQVDIVTVFTEGPSSEETLSPLAQRFHQEWEAEKNPYKKRREEAKEATDLINAEIHWLGLREALYRNPELASPEELLVPDRDPKRDPSFQKVLQAIEEFLKKLFNKTLTERRNCPPSASPVLVFAPLGAGAHLDHTLVHKSVRVLSRKLPGIETWYYEDFPYVLDIDALKRRIGRLKGRWRTATVEVSSTIEDRVALSSQYSSQVKSIFQSEEELRKRIHDYASYVGSPGRPRERFWKKS